MTAKAMGDDDDRDDRQRQQLEAAFASVRQRFFPRWDRQRRWRVRLGTLTGSPLELGFCDRIGNTIWAAPRLLVDPDGLETVLAHELCHATTGLGHGSAFLRRMRTTTVRARELGASRLAARLALDIERIVHGRPLRAADVYALARAYVGRSARPSYPALLEGLKNLLGVPAEQLEAKYTRLAHAFNAAIQEPPLPGLGGCPDELDGHADFIRDHGDGPFHKP